MNQARACKASYCGVADDVRGLPVTPGVCMALMLIPEKGVMV